MPVHDWSKVDANAFHDFHTTWISEIKKALNRGILPPGYSARAEQKTGIFTPDVIALQEIDFPSPVGNQLLATAPRVKQILRQDSPDLQRNPRVLAIRHNSGNHLVAVIEIVSPANKASETKATDFVSKAYSLLQQGIQLVVIDLFAPPRRDKRTFHEMVWQTLSSIPYAPIPDAPLTLASYETDGYRTNAYVEPFRVGDDLSDMPLYLKPDGYVLLPLQKTYDEAWKDEDRSVKALLEIVG